MTDERLVELFAVPEFFCDGFDDFHVAEGLLRCVGYRLQPVTGCEPLKIIVVRLVMPSSGAFEAAAKTKDALLSPVRGLEIASTNKSVN